jgi:RHS repeat-associated protein
MVGTMVLMQSTGQSTNELYFPLARARAGGFVGSTDFQEATSRDKTALEVRFAWENTDTAESHVTNFDHEYHRNQQYSVTAITNSSAGIVERYAYQAYGEPTILDASASILSSSSISNRYTYTGREWDGTVGLYHFRARWMSGLTGRFLQRDPIGYWGGPWCLYQYCDAMPHVSVDPSGLDAGTALPWMFPRNPPPRVPGGPPLPPGAPPPRVSYEDGIRGLDAISRMLGQLCLSCCTDDDCGCVQDALQIKDALLHVWRSNYGYGPLGANQGGIDDSVGGHLCWEWTNMFYDAVSRLQRRSTCYTFHRMRMDRNEPYSGYPDFDPMHAFIRISVGDGGTGCELNVDDGWGTGNGTFGNEGTPIGDPDLWGDPYIWPGPYELR